VCCRDEGNSANLSPVCEAKRWKYLFCAKEPRQRLHSDAAGHAFSPAGEEVALERPAMQLGHHEAALIVAGHLGVSPSDQLPVLSVRDGIDDIEPVFARHERNVVVWASEVHAADV